MSCSLCRIKSSGLFCAIAHEVSAHLARYSQFYRLMAYIAQLDLSYLEHIDKDDGGEDIDAEDNDSDEEAGDKSAFGRLVLPKGHKKMVLSLIAQHFRNKGSQDEQADIVRGKGMLLSNLWLRNFSNIKLSSGKGLIILLHGAPGVGKTTTAGTKDPCITLDS